MGIRDTLVAGLAQANPPDWVWVTVVGVLGVLGGIALNGAKLGRILGTFEERLNSVAATTVLQQQTLESIREELTELVKIVAEMRGAERRVRQSDR